MAGHITDTPIRYLKGIGSERAKLFERLDIRTYGDLLAFFPRDYEDRTVRRDIADLPSDVPSVTTGVLSSPAQLARVRSGMTLVKTAVADDTGELHLVFFNRDYLKSALKLGESYVIYGKATVKGGLREMVNPEITPLKGDFAGEILPVYPLTAGLTQNLMRRAVRETLALTGDDAEEPLPEELREVYHLATARFALANIHFPLSDEAMRLSRRRLVFSELLILSLSLARLKNGTRWGDGLLLSPCDPREFSSVLPFSLTSAQRRAIGEVYADMTSGRSMNRLIQGDVGSGKTMVGAAAVFLAAKNGLQSVIMSPTELLANQHYKNLAPLFARFGIASALLTGSTPAAEKRRVLAGLADGSIGFVSGTNAVIQSGVAFHSLGLVVCDEQHRFGVRERTVLSQKGKHPHTLVMSATPIPRTLALAIFGELDLSVIDELPPGRQKIDTFTVGEDYRPRIEAFVRKQVAEGRQVYIVCPLVDENEDLELKPAREFAEHLQKDVYPSLRVALLHGRMSGKEKDRVMSSFSSGETDVLVSTTVVEVGVDVPNATLMVVENAERYGLSQLHQLRGRVGRGASKSYCILISDGGEKAKERLGILCKTNDGFKIAEADLELRGPGEFFGKRQHGLPDLKIASLSGDMRTLSEAQTAAAELLERDPPLERGEHAPLRRAVDRMLARLHEN